MHHFMCTTVPFSALLLVCLVLQCMMSGLALGTAVLYADLYFILKKPEVLELEEAKSQRESKGSSHVSVKSKISSSVGT